MNSIVKHGLAQTFFQLIRSEYFSIKSIVKFGLSYIKSKSILSNLFHIPQDLIEKKLLESQINPKFVPVRIKRNLSLHEVATLESNKFFLPGVDIDSAPRRDYVGTEAQSWTLAG